MLTPQAEPGWYRVETPASKTEERKVLILRSSQDITVRNQH